MTLQEAERYVDQKLERLKTALEQEPLGKESKLRLRHELFMLEGAVGVLRDSLTRPSLKCTRAKTRIARWLPPDGEKR